MGELFNPEIKDIRAKTLTVGQAIALSRAAYDTTSKVEKITCIGLHISEEEEMSPVI